MWGSMERIGDDVDDSFLSVKARENKMNSKNICIIGGGSRAWAITFMKDLSLAPEASGRITLYDINAQSARNNVAVGTRIFERNNAAGKFEIVAEDNLDKALEGADLVIISIEPGATSCRYGDLVLPQEYGILQTVGDTTGPGGIFRARRALPLFFEFGRAVQKNCPHAWVINYTNPMTLCTGALYRAFPDIKALGCCHEVFHTQHYLAELVAQWFGVPTPDRREIHVDITGVNHFTFATKATWRGHDLMPGLREIAAHTSTFSDLTIKAQERIREEKWFDNDKLVALDLLRTTGALGAAGDRHLAEFVPWYRADEKELWKLGVVRTPYEWRVSQAAEKREKVFTDDDLMATPSDEEGVDIMRSLMGERTLRTNINVPNQGQVSYLKKGHIVESNGFISQDSIEPIMSSDPPLAVQSLVRHVADVQEMTLDAVWREDDELLFSAFILDPLVRLPLEKARELFGRMKEASALTY